MEITVAAKVEELQKVLDFVDEFLEEKECSMKAQVQIDIALEEIFVNVAHYAYTPNDGNVTITLDYDNNDRYLSVTLMDQGIPFDPLAKEDPDVTLAAEDRQIGGLGIYMVKKSMDEVSYSREGDNNVFCFKKHI